MDQRQPLDPTAARNARYGLWLFIVYFVLYGGFIALTAFSFDTMGQPAILGVNVAIVYGMVLIAVALLLALVYMRLCRPTGGEDSK